MKYVKGDFVIGNVLMNMNSPKKLTQSENESLSLTKRLLKKFGTRHAFTPRFAITTTPRVMKEGSRMADKAREMGCLQWEPKDMAAHIGYICAALDPDGNVVEFSHNQKVFSTIRDLWGDGS